MSKEKIKFNFREIWVVEPKIKRTFDGRNNVPVLGTSVNCARDHMCFVEKKTVVKTQIWIWSYKLKFPRLRQDLKLFISSCLLFWDLIFSTQNRSEIVSRQATKALSFNFLLISACFSGLDLLPKKFSKKKI